MPGRWAHRDSGPGELETMVTTSGPTRRAGRPPETATDQAQPPRHPPATTDQAPLTRRPGRPRRVEPGDAKAALLAAALTLFARHGYAGTSIRAIAREVGLSESVLYAHFDSKRAIFEAVLAQLCPRG